MKLRKLSLKDAIALNHCGATLKYSLYDSSRMYDCPPEVWSPPEYDEVLEDNLRDYTFYVEVEGDDTPTQ